MPIYEYRCEACGFLLEALQKVDEAPLARCPECGEDRLRKQLTAAGFQLKGSGWYETDFKTKPKKKSGEQEAGKDGKKAEAGAAAKAATPESSKSSASSAAGGSGE